MSSLMKLRAVDVRFGAVTALSDINLKVAAGQRLALIGANGSGKSTLLRVLNGLVKPSSGSVLRDSSMRQAMMFQRPHMLRASALANVALAQWLRGVPWNKAREQAVLALGRVGLGELAFRNARTLSTGQQQRLALARAWSLKPDALLLDEPTANLDPHNVTLIEDIVRQQNRQFGTTVVLVTHNVFQAKRLAHRVGLLLAGKLVELEDTPTFFECPRDSRTLAFVKGDMVC